jgi:hypothetical protein
MSNLVDPTIEIVSRTLKVAFPAYNPRVELRRRLGAELGRAHRTLAWLIGDWWHFGWHRPAPGFDGLLALAVALP